MAQPWVLRFHRQYMHLLCVCANFGIQRLRGATVARWIWKDQRSLSVPDLLQRVTI